MITEHRVHHNHDRDDVLDDDDGDDDDAKVLRGRMPPVRSFPFVDMLLMMIIV